MLFVTRLRAPRSIYKTHQFVYSLFNKKKGKFSFLRLRNNNVVIFSRDIPTLRVTFDVIEFPPGFYRFFVRANIVKQRKDGKRRRLKKDEVGPWLANKLAQYGCNLLEFEIIRQGYDFVDKGRGFPVSYYEIAGLLYVCDPHKVEDLVINGIGREKGFGYGTPLLKQCENRADYKKYSRSASRSRRFVK